MMKSLFLLKKIKNISFSKNLFNNNKSRKQD